MKRRRSGYSIKQVYCATSEDVDQFLKTFAEITKMFMQQPGFISAQLHRGIGGSAHFLIMVFGSLQNILNGPSINQSYGQASLTFFPIP